MDNGNSALLLYGPYLVSAGDRGPNPRPDRALVFTLSDGQVEELTRRPSAFGAMRYRYRYEVDRSDHAQDWQAELHSGTGGFSFQAQLEARWRVADAAQVVRRNICSVGDGERLVRSGVLTALWSTTRGYGIESLHEAQDQLHRLISGHTIPLPEGIEVFSLAVRLFLDADTQQHLRDMKRQQRERELTVDVHRTNVITTEQDSQLALIAQRREAERQAEREHAILAASRGEGGLLVHLIAQDPSRLHQILNELMARRDMEIDQKTQLLHKLADDGLLQPAEAQEMVRTLHLAAPVWGGAAGALPPTAAPELMMRQGADPAPPLPGVTVPPRPTAPPPGAPDPDPAPYLITPDPEPVPYADHTIDVDPDPDPPSAGPTELSEPSEPSEPSEGDNVVGVRPVGKARQRPGGPE